MKNAIGFATFNACNLALPGMQCYDNLPPYTLDEFAAKTSWIARQIDLLDADVIGFQEIFSLAALQTALDKTRHYRHATLIGFDPDPALPVLTPSVAMVSRLPLDMEPITHADFPRNLAVPLPDGAGAARQFTRPVLQASVVLSDKVSAQVLVLHFKSKRPDYLNGDASSDDPYLHGVAALRSHVRRGAEALGLRYLLIDIRKQTGMPVVVLGDFNDNAAAVSTQLLMGSDQGGEAARQARLFDSARLKAGTDGATPHTVMYEGHGDTIDHILVTDDFHPANPRAIGEVCDVSYFGEHLVQPEPLASDHAQVRASIRLFGGARP